MKTWPEKFGLPILVSVAAGSISKVLLGLDLFYLVALIVVIFAASFFVPYAIRKVRVSKSGTDLVCESSPSMPVPADGNGGRGGGGNALGKDAVIIGGRGGRGSILGTGSGGDGGGGDAIGTGSMVIGGDGGDAGRIDGRGGAGGASPLKRLSPEKLKSWGLTGNEGYGQGGAAANSPEYDRSLRVLSLLSAEYASKNPKDQLSPMPGVLMPPVGWVNGRLSEMRESFYVELIDNGIDFLLRPNSASDQS
jgi:hypothetical protein